jgi:hypothetical protein
MEQPAENQNAQESEPKIEVVFDAHFPDIEKIIEEISKL